MEKKEAVCQLNTINMTKDPSGVLFVQAQLMSPSGPRVTQENRNQDERRRYMRRKTQQKSKRAIPRPLRLGFAGAKNAKVSSGARKDPRGTISARGGHSVRRRRVRRMLSVDWPWKLAKV